VSPATLQAIAAMLVGLFAASATFPATPQARPASTATKAATSHSHTCYAPAAMTGATAATKAAPLKQTSTHITQQP